LFFFITHLPTIKQFDILFSLFIFFLSSFVSLSFLFAFAAGMMGVMPENRILIGDYMVAPTTS